MNRLFRRATILAALGAAALGASAASATAFTFNFTGSNTSPAGSLGASACPTGTTSCSSTQDLGLTVYGGHLNSTGSGSSTLSGASVEEWKGAGLGVLFGADKESNGTHQFDNYGGGSDMVALVFDQDVTLSSLSRASYTGQGAAPGLGSDTDISFLAYTGTLSALAASGATVDLGSFSSLNSGSVATNSAASSKIWLVAANVTGQKDDAFKLTQLVANTRNPGAVPEPASWAMMLVGFGAVGAALRRRRPAGLAAA